MLYIYGIPLTVTIKMYVLYIPLSLLALMQEIVTFLHQNCSTELLSFSDCNITTATQM